MPPSDRDAPDFAGDWLEEQRRFWEGFRGDAGCGAYAEAERAWNAACDRWWSGVEDSVPAPLACVLRGALEQARACMALARGLAEGGHEGLLIGAMSPERVLRAAADALDAPQAGNGSPAEREYARAFLALNEMVAGVVHEALPAIRERLAREHARTPRQVHDIYAEEIEARYLAVASGDAFAQRVGDLVDARVELIARSRERAP